MHPHLDDFAQIAGTKVECKNWDKASYRTDAKEIGKASKGRNAVLIKGHGALCTGNSEFDIGYQLGEERGRASRLLLMEKRLEGHGDA